MFNDISKELNNLNNILKFESNSKSEKINEIYENENADLLIKNILESTES